MIPNQPLIEPIQRPSVDSSPVFVSWDAVDFAAPEMNSFLESNEMLLDVSPPDLESLSREVQKATDQAIAPHADSELPYDYLAKKSDVKSRLVLEGSCTYHKPRPPLAKDTTLLTEDELNAYRDARDEKVVLNNLLFGLLEQHIEDVVQLGFLRDEIDPIITTRQPRAGHFNFESFLLFCAKQNSANIDPKAKAKEWLEAWKALKATRIGNDPAINEKIRELRSFQSTPDEVADNGRAKQWFKINKIYKRDQSLAQIQISREDALRLIAAGNLLYRITDLVESIEQHIWGDYIIVEYQKNPATGRYSFFKMACQFSKAITPLMEILNEYQDLYKNHLKTANPHLHLAENFKINPQTQAAIVNVLGSIDKNKLQEFIARLLVLKNQLDNTLKDLPNPDKEVDKVAAKDILQKNQLLHQIDELSGINPSTLSALLKDADPAIINHFLKSKPEDLKSIYRAKTTGFGPRIKEICDLHNNHFSRLLSFHYVLITGNDADKGGMASLDLHVTALKNDCQVECKTQLSIALQKMFKDFGRDFLSSTQAKKTSDLIKSFSKIVLENVKKELTQNFKQYKQHSFLRFLNFIAIHHRHKQNIDAIIELVPKDFPERDSLIKDFKQFIRDVINSSLEDADAKHLFDYRKLQASCKGKEEAHTCREEMGVLYSVLYLYHMHHIDGVDTTAKGGYFDELEESHVIPFPAIWGYHYEKLKLGVGNDALAFPKEAIANYLSSNGWCFSKTVGKDGILDVEKFQLGFIRLLTDLREEINQIDPVDPDYPKAIKLSLIQAFVQVNMAAIHESSQTTHLISISNKVMDRLSETALNAGKYKEGLALSFLALLDANHGDTLGVHYNWYYEETLKTVECFSKSIMGYAQAPLNVQASTIKNVFKSGNVVTVLGERFRIETAIYKEFRDLLNHLSNKDPRQFYIDSLYALSIMVREIPLSMQEAKVFLNEMMETYASLKKEPTSVCFKDKRKEKATLLKFLYELVPFTHIECHVGCDSTRPNNCIEENIRRIRALFKQKQDFEYRALRITKNYVGSEHSLAEFGRMVTGLMQLRLAACIPQAIRYAQPLQSNKKVYQVQT